MIANGNSIDLGQVLSEHLERAEPDLLRSLVKTFVEALMGAEADAICGAPYGTRSAERVNSRNGYRAREWDTRAGSIELALPKLRSGSYFPDWLLERRKRAERALTTVVATCYLLRARLPPGTECTRSWVYRLKARYQAEGEAAPTTVETSEDFPDCHTGGHGGADRPVAGETDQGRSGRRAGHHRLASAASSGAHIPGHDQPAADHGRPGGAGAEGFPDI